jgi:Na+/melibiose symporter-like transporter
LEGLSLVARPWDSINDPVIGFLSDKTPKSLGRRRIWIIASIPMIRFLNVHSFSTPPDAGAGYLLTRTLAIYTAGTMAIVPMNAWSAEITDAYQQRNRINGIRAASGLFGTLAALTIPAITGQQGSQDLRATLEIIILLVIATMNDQLIDHPTIEPG